MLLMLRSFSAVVKRLLADLPRHDFPVLDTRYFLSVWLQFSLDPALESMQALFKRLECSGQRGHISTFSKANSVRSIEPFRQVYQDALAWVKQVRGQKTWLFPIDSTSITLTSKLLHEQGWSYVKLFAGVDAEGGAIEGVRIVFGQGHDHRQMGTMVASVPEEAVGVMDRGFASLECLRKTKQLGKDFLLRIKSNWSLQMKENGKMEVGTGKAAEECRVVAFCDVEKRQEYRLATSLGEKYSNEEIGEMYRKRWQIELLWKFLKMHLKLDNLITKNASGIEKQIYAALIAYFILELVEIPRGFGGNLLEKFRCIQAESYENGGILQWLQSSLGELRGKNCVRGNRETYA